MAVRPPPLTADDLQGPTWTAVAPARATSPASVGKPTGQRSCPGVRRPDHRSPKFPCWSATTTPDPPPTTTSVICTDPPMPTGPTTPSTGIGTGAGRTSQRPGDHRPCGCWCHRPPVLIKVAGKRGPGLGFTVHDLVAEVDPSEVALEGVEAHPTRCPHPANPRRHGDAHRGRQTGGDSLGGIITCVARDVPAGLGDPVFDRMEADLAKGMLSLPAAKGFDVGSGFDAVAMTGRQHNDPFSPAPTAPPRHPTDRGASKAASPTALTWSSGWRSSPRPPSPPNRTR
ncbi:MAG: hypothetical protein Ct9H300mP12_00110 [Acidimicrobiales bacterium]|nr:MAG: hypothetical protein Ct9H300mP12_00110 [Acidimicrobiales bacterium]